MCKFCVEFWLNMFKKSEKLPPLPKPPTVDQIVEDIDTFKEEGHEVEKFRWDWTIKTTLEGIREKSTIFRVFPTLNYMYFYVFEIHGFLRISSLSYLTLETFIKDICIDTITNFYFLGKLLQIRNIWIGIGGVYFILLWKTINN